MGEYKRQWDVYLKRIGKYEEPKKDSMQIKKLQDSLKVLNEANRNNNTKRK